MLNNVSLIGRLTQDPQLSYTSNGKAMARFNLAVGRKFKNPATNNYDADFIDIVAWGKTAETVADYMKKGSLIAVEGRIQTGSYEDKDGNKRKSCNVVAESVHFLEKKGSGEGKPEPAGEEDDNIPF